MGTPLPGTVIAAEITTGNTDNTFSIGDTNLMQGGHHSVTTLSERDSIAMERRRVGMTCWVSGTVNLNYQLFSGTNNADWIVATPPAPSLSTLPDVSIPSPSDNQVLTYSGSLWVALNPVDQVALDIANSAYAIAVTGTNVGYQAQAVANLALQIATTGTNVGYQSQAVADEALQIAIIGTQLGTQAFNLAQQAYDLASSGTEAGAAYALAQSAYALAQTGTNVGYQAQAVADEALQIAITGTNDAADASDIATQAYCLAVAGTNSSTTCTNPSAEVGLNYVN